MEAEMATANLGKVALTMLGLLAFQNRDKIADFLKSKQGEGGAEGGGLLDQLSHGVSGTALGDILDRFRSSGSGEKVDTWVRSGPNAPISRDDVTSAIDEETLEALAQQTGLSKETLIERITRDLPSAVDRVTPDGKIPDHITVASGEPNLLDDVPPSKS
jgi:uncharacterized protein YidB (DUF937 family)